ncbi:unnamed protein product [Vitrella brassicaformis CCMP3155]|uniref:Uncharacterized protein n=2 Tax=Vitrella brassicaformis TaxID=1169539 RepID=A0A0G4H5M8_VITBC|nr:unnamed protein product [Vitrella brassicaformis CCMP3155]|mmetsp:Transcript_21086/g.51440  ORF Transcript_21086/g.51440 Transcript_21086/m.51440 type:complete len:120 (+) Transcript_21086:80-439(+)|eukprot:CEM39119.1 unnamed protein product [Vitrella brassicaformis CCMP3155]
MVAGLKLALFVALAAVFFTAMGLSILFSAEHIRIEDSLPEPCTKSKDCPKGLKCYKQVDDETGKIDQEGLCKERGDFGDHCGFTKWCGKGLACKLFFYDNTDELTVTSTRSCDWKSHLD